MIFFIIETTKIRQMKNMRRIRMLEICFLILFTIILLFSVVFAVVLHMFQFSLALLLIDLLVAGMIAIYGSLSIREEEEET